MKNPLDYITDYTSQLETLGEKYWQYAILLVIAITAIILYSIIK